MKTGFPILTLTRITFSTQIEICAGYRYRTSLSEPFPNVYEQHALTSAPLYGDLVEQVVAVHTESERARVRACGTYP